VGGEFDRVCRRLTRGRGTESIEETAIASLVAIRSGASWPN